MRGAGEADVRGEPAAAAAAPAPCIGVRVAGVVVAAAAVAAAGVALVGVEAIRAVDLAETRRRASMNLRDVRRAGTQVVPLVLSCSRALVLS